MSRPRRSTSNNTGGHRNTISWDRVVIDKGSEQERSGDDENTEFGSDEIYSKFPILPCSTPSPDPWPVSDLAAAEASPTSEDEYGSDNHVAEELLTPPGHNTLSYVPGDVESELEGDFAFVPVLDEKPFFA